MDDPAGARIRIHPIADRYQGELEEPQICAAAGVLAALEAIAHPEGPAPRDKSLTGEAYHGILRSDGQAGGEKTQEGR